MNKLYLNIITLHVKELFLEQMRVIDSHPYENVDDDGHPLVDNKEDTDYETVVVSTYLLQFT